MNNPSQTMKKILPFLIIFFVITPLYAYENKKSEYGFYLSSKVYEERHPVDNSFFMSQDGFMLGLVLNGDNYDTYYTGYRTRFGYGQVDYASAGTGTMADIPDWQIEGTWYFGLPFENETYRITPIAGLGYRYLLNASGHKLSSSGHSGYDRESRYLYLPVGLNFETQTSQEGTYWELRGEYLFFLWGQQKSYLSDVGASFSDITNDQEEGSGIKLSARYYLDKNFSIEGYTEFWDIADSKLDVSGNFMEPRNTTRETGVRLLWKY
jgi:hypothetical protein|tara:strand:+ start:1070 stop:1867 length:798 start_codon:yes stop_codon:yes gene_type:complete